MVGERYNEETDLLTIVTDRCPTSKQNYEYAMFLLTALYFESWKVESWEELKTEIDMKYYEWEKSDSQKNLIELLQYNNIDENRKKEFQPKYGASISSVWNGGKYFLKMYKSCFGYIIIFNIILLFRRKQSIYQQIWRSCKANFKFASVIIDSF